VNRNLKSNQYISPATTTLKYVGSAEAEQGVSVMNDIATCKRSKLTRVTTDRIWIGHWIY
jgi:hypothetical protein